MKPATRRYYAELQADYGIKIRQLVPKYDEMVACIIELLEMHAPRTILDIGAGIGNVSEQILERLPAARVTALEPSQEMYADAHARLHPFGDRVELVQRDIRDFSPARRYEAIVSSLVLHNIEPAEKQLLLRSCRTWLEPRGYFIWGDLIRHPDPQAQSYFVEQRKAYAREQGGAEALVRWNFEKEDKEDHPLTVEETIAEGRRAGFESVDLVWAHDTFAIFLLPAHPSAR